MSKVLHLNTPASGESTILSTWSSTSSISTLSSVAAASSELEITKTTFEPRPMSITGSISGVLESSPFQHEQRLAEMVLNHPDIARTSSGKPQIVFIHKLYDMLSNDSISHLIRWAPDSISFYIFPGESFCKVLAQYFKHTNMSSFIRQLNMYGFHKVNDNNNSVPSSEIRSTNSKWEFRHSQNHFKKGDFESLKYIKRRSSKTTNDQKEVVDLKSIPHTSEYLQRQVENEHSPFDTHFSTPSPSQAPRNQYPPLFPNQVPQMPHFSMDAPAFQPNSLLQTQHIERTPPRLKSPLTSNQPPLMTTTLHNFNQSGPDTTLPLPQTIQQGQQQQQQQQQHHHHHHHHHPRDYVHQRPPITTQYSFESANASAAAAAVDDTKSTTLSSEAEFWKRKHADLTADFDTLVGIVESGTNIDVEYQRFKKSRSARQQLNNHSMSMPLMTSLSVASAPQSDNSTHLSTYYPQFKPKFNLPVLQQRAESKSYSPMGTPITQKDYFLQKQQLTQQQQMPVLKIPSLMVNQLQVRTNSLPGELQKGKCPVSPNTRLPTGKRNSDSVISAPRLPSVNELTSNLPVFNPNLNIKRKRSA
ncbi:SFL1 [Candida theae]|uniref:Heat shock transcription factor n=1 Tax=Candida theae TaxID=1198502 RepID=A0AAD5BFF9_9ASCO|nr:SFL1 [Candida theae]KAI5958919.1 SFL1 [Candida theae]